MRIFGKGSISTQLQSKNTRAQSGLESVCAGLNPWSRVQLYGSSSWFAPFFSVRILTRKVASAKPLYYRKRGSASYTCIVREVLLGRERERERERERYREREREIDRRK